MPAFEIGVWDAWIFVIPMPGVFFFDVRVTAARESGRSGDFQLTGKAKWVINAILLPMVVINKVQMTKFQCQIKAKAQMTRAIATGFALATTIRSR
jgi:prophage tail gpP-like protein